MLSRICQKTKDGYMLKVHEYGHDLVANRILPADATQAEREFSFAEMELEYRKRRAKEAGLIIA